MAPANVDPIRLRGPIVDVAGSLTGGRYDRAAMPSVLQSSRASEWTQCTVAGRELAQETCCRDGSAAHCNVPWYLDRALTRTGNLRSRQRGTIPGWRILGRLRAGRPVGARIQWAGDGGHFVVIAGARGLLGRSASVSRRSRSPPSPPVTRANGTWTHTYFTAAHEVYTRRVRPRTVDAITSAEQEDRVRDSDFALRLLRVPALHLTALWLRGTDGTDVIVPLAPAPRPFEPNRSYDAEEFAARAAELAGAARKRGRAVDRPHEAGG
jgi:hypothetical protein